MSVEEGGVTEELRGEELSRLPRRQGGYVKEVWTSWTVGRRGGCGSHETTGSVGCLSTLQCKQRRRHVAATWLTVAARSGSSTCASSCARAAGLCCAPGDRASL